MMAPRSGHMLQCVALCLLVVLDVVHGNRVSITIIEGASRGASTDTTTSNVLVPQSVPEPPLVWDGPSFLTLLDQSNSPRSLLPQIPDTLDIKNPITPYGGFGKPLQPVCNFEAYLPCADPPAALKTILTQTPYRNGDATRSIVNVTASALNGPILGEFNEYLKGLSNMSSTYWACREGGFNNELAQCTMSWLTAWARESALGVGEMNNTRHGNKILAFYTAGMVIPYLRIKDDPTLKAEDIAFVDAWLTKVANLIVATQVTADNNIRYWAGLSTLTTGIAVKDVSLIRWSVGSYIQFLGNIRPDGLLITELFRAHLASTYHAYAVRPLVLMAWLAKNSVDLDLIRLHDSALNKVFGLVAKMALEDDYILQLEPTLPPQIKGGALQIVDAAEVFHRWNRNVDITALLQQNRPVYCERTGGFITMIWGLEL